MDKRLSEYLHAIGADESTLDGWTVSEAFRGGESVGFVMVNGTEIHVLPLAEKKAMSRRNILEFLEPIFAEHGYATTRVPITVTDHRLRDKLGFRETWRDEQFIYFAATELPFKRETT